MPRGASRPHSDSDDDTQSTPNIPPPPKESRRRSSRRLSDFRRDQDDADPYRPMRRGGSRRRHRGERDQGYSMPREKSGSRMTLLLSKYNSTSQHWKTAPVTIDRHRDSDIDAWTDIRRVFRDDLQKPWRRIFGFKRVRHVLPITYTVNGIPLKTVKPDNFMLGHAFLHAYHHPERLKLDQHWIEWFEEFERENARDAEWGLQFVEGLWADKLAGTAIFFTVVIIVVSAVWCALGGDLQTVFTVMSFVLGGITAELALVALYYQVTSPS